MTMTFPPTGGCLPGALRDRLVLIISFMLYFLLDEFMTWHAVSGNGRTAIPLRWDWLVFGEMLVRTRYDTPLLSVGLDWNVSSSSSFIFMNMLPLMYFTSNKAVLSHL